ncbi:MAG: triose-phosphate isomerase [Clostridia bacterium]|nr:triose-phosphate isomerase [Clostridia bacterium]
MTRRPIFAANWKMNLESSDIDKFMEDIVPVANNTSAEVVIFPPSVYLAQVAKAAGSKIRVGSQNHYWEKPGAFTGEISVNMVKDCGATYALAGHSERRHIFNESAEIVTRKAGVAQKEGLLPMICVGETLEEREAGETLDVLRSDIICSLRDVEANADVVIAYEPVWAIGTGRTATTAQAQEVCALIRDVIRGLYSGDIADAAVILYGGSMNAANAADLLAEPDVDGGLIGGASLKPIDFTVIAKAAEA